MKTVTIEELRNDLEALLEEAHEGETIIVKKDNQEICYILPSKEARLALFDSLAGIASDVDPEKARDERIEALREFQADLSENVEHMGFKTEQEAMDFAIKVRKGK